MKIEHRADHLRLDFEDGTPALRFHWFWLRHNCPDCVHPSTNERTLDARDVSLRIEPRTVTLVGDAVRIRWPGPDAHESTFGVGWLRAHAYGPETTLVAPPHGELAPVTLAAEAHRAVGALAAAALARVEAHGLAIVRGYGEDTEALIEEFLDQGLFVRGTHFGRIEDLRTDNTTNQNTDQLGYTDAPVELHTDQPFIDAPPHYQLLQAMRAADSGGESLIADVRAALRWLRAVDLDAWQILVTTPVTLHRKQKNFESKVVAPIFEIDAEGRLLKVRHSYFTFAPHNVAFERMEAFYRAYQRFQAIVHDPRHHWRFLLEPGDFVFYDNHRVLHARTGFQGPRWVRGVYFDTADSRKANTSPEN
jgi:alpha-ketoglutarate-dependent taurine dioxygenase